MVGSWPNKSSNINKCKKIFIMKNVVVVGSHGETKVKEKLLIGFLIKQILLSDFKVVIIWAYLVMEKVYLIKFFSGIVRKGKNIF